MQFSNYEWYIYKMICICVIHVVNKYTNNIISVTYNGVYLEFFVVIISGTH